jgi:hypothetical protein
MEMDNETTGIIYLHPFITFYLFGIHWQYLTDKFIYQSGIAG